MVILKLVFFKTKMSHFQSLVTLLELRFRGGQRILVEGARRQFSSAFYVIVRVSSHHLDTTASTTNTKQGLNQRPKHRFIELRARPISAVKIYL